MCDRRLGESFDDVESELVRFRVGKGAEEPRGQALGLAASCPLRVAFGTISGVRALVKLNIPVRAALLGGVASN